ncbi:hypothetical protein [Coprococcus comes]|uniref:hypothetical protein n=1 Tax=Coprococcus comes TaxID=410072 RepID=UPI0034A1E068
MENYIMKHDFAILIYKEEDMIEYNAAIKALTATKKQSGWNRVQGVKINKDCRIPSIYHGNDWAIIMERDNGKGEYTIEVQNFPIKK